MKPFVSPFASEDLIRVTAGTKDHAGMTSKNIWAVYQPLTDKMYFREEVVELGEATMREYLMHEGEHRKQAKRLGKRKFFIFYWGNKKERAVFEAEAYAAGIAAKTAYQLEIGEIEDWEIEYILRLGVEETATKLKAYRCKMDEEALTDIFVRYFEEAGL